MYTQAQLIYFSCFIIQTGIYTEKCPLRIWKKIDHSISNNFSSMPFFAQRVFYEVVKVYVCTTVLDRHKIQDSGHSNK